MGDAESEIVTHAHVLGMLGFIKWRNFPRLGGLRMEEQDQRERASGRWFSSCVRDQTYLGLLWPSDRGWLGRVVKAASALVETAKLRD